MGRMKKASKEATIERVVERWREVMWVVVVERRRWRWSIVCSAGSCILFLSDLPNEVVRLVVPSGSYHYRDGVVFLSMDLGSEITRMSFTWE